MTKAGQADVRRLLIIGAMSRLNWLGQRTITEGSYQPTDAGWMAAGHRGSRPAAAACAAEKRQRSPPPPQSGSSSGALSVPS